MVVVTLLIGAAVGGSAPFATAKGPGGGGAAVDCRVDRTGVAKCSVTTRGSTMSFFDGAAVVVVPSGAVATKTTVTGTQLDVGGVEDLVTGTGIALSPATGWTQPLTLTLRYDPAALNGADEGALQVFELSGGSWQPVASSTVDASADTVSAVVTGLGSFAVGAEPSAPTAVSIEEDDVIVGYTIGSGWASVPLTATVTDADGNPVSVPVTWSTSDSAILSVDGDGVVQGTGYGETTVTATVGALSDTISVCVEGGTPYAPTVEPGSGLQPPPILPLMASGTTNCGTSNGLRYFWKCAGTASSSCNQFLAAAGGAAGGTLTSYDFPLGAGEVFTITLQVCAVTCSPQTVKEYFGAEL